VNACGNFATQLAGGRTLTDVSGSSIIFAAAGGTAGKLVTGAPDGTLSGPGVEMGLARPLAQVTTGLALTPNVVMASNLASRAVDIRVSDLPQVSVVESDWQPTAPPSFDPATLQWMIDPGQPRTATTPDILRGTPPLSVGPAASATSDVLRDLFPGAGEPTNYTGGGSGGGLRPSR